MEAAVAMEVVAVTEEEEELEVMEVDTEEVTGMGITDMVITIILVE